MKVIIFTDLEGAAGVVSFENQAYKTGKYFEQAKELLTEEVNASCEGLLAAGVDDIFVIDGHGDGGIVFSKLHAKAQLLHGRPMSMYWEIDKKCDTVFLLAHHAMNGTEDGNLNHTYSSQNIVNMTLNNSKIGEIGMNIFLAGWFDIPVTLISGDEAACREAEKYVPNIEKAIVKKGINRTCAISLSPTAAREIIKQKSFNAIQRIKHFRPVKELGICELTIEFISSADAFFWYQCPYVEKINSTTIKIRAENFIDLWQKWFTK